MKPTETHAPAAEPETVRIENVSRRELLKGGAALTLALYLPAVPAVAGAPAAVPSAPPFEPNAFLRIGADDSVTIISKHLEMGQGVYTGLATLVADELDADWKQLRVEGAPADDARYKNLFLGFQGTGGSTAIANSFMQYREAGATARAMLVAAAAAQWQVAASEISVSRGVVSHAASGRHAKFGELVGAAAQQGVPTGVKLKDPAQFAYIGRAVPRLDAQDKVNGAALFTQDVKLPDMLTAVVAHPPRFGAKVRGVDAAAAKAVKGVIAVVPFATPVRSGVAVLAKDFWSAKKGRDALQVDWDESGAWQQGTEAILADYRRLAATPGAVARREGDVAAAFKRAARVVEATYEVPFLAHAAMEPMNAVARVSADGAEIWSGVQQAGIDKTNIAQFLGLPPEKVQLNMLYAGGSFGRRGNMTTDYMLEAVAIARAHGAGVPVKLVWTREDDMRAGYYRPLYVHALRAGLDAGGTVMAWQHRIVGQSIAAGGPMQRMIKNGIDPTSVEGAANLPYTISNLSVELHTTSPGVPILFWRSVGSSHNAYVTEAFFDEVARAAGKDPYAFRRALLGDRERHQAVLSTAAQKVGWDTPLPAGKARGIAVAESFGSYVAEVAEVARVGDGFKVERVVCAVDCGLAVNPNLVVAQVESAVNYGLAAAASGAITLKDGIVEQSNFHDYPVLRMSQAPKIEVYVLASKEKPSGIGEPGVPPIAPAVCNAIAQLTGKPVRTLPLATQGLKIV